MDSTRLDVVIVSYGPAALLDRCLTSLERFPPPGGLRTIVVDNAADPEVGHLVLERHPGVELVAPGSNIGFGPATNIGIRRTAGPYVLALNPDAEVTEGCLEQLLDRIERNPTIGCIGPALIRPDGSPDHAAKRGFPTPLNSLGYFTGLDRRLEGPFSGYTAPEVEQGPVDAVNGAFMLLRRHALEEVGLFDEGYWMYMEDLDLSRRLADAGWISWYEPGATARHIKAGTTGGGRTPRLEIAFHRGMGRYYRRHQAPGNPGPVNALVYAGIGIKLALTLARAGLNRG